MKGKKRDVHWARAIRKRMLSELERRAEEMRIAGLDEKAARVKLWLERVREAKWFIRNRFMGTRTLIHRLSI